VAKNQVKVTIASYNFLYEISAIPGKIRQAYLNKLLTRKSVSPQKNVILLKYLNNCIDANRINGWDPEVICRQTGISMNALYIHKSRLLASLRKYYFKWNELESKIECNIAKEYKRKSFFKEEEKEIDLMLAKARKMSEIGMMSEARDMYLNLEKTARKAFIDQSTKYIIVSEIYEYCAYYYFSKRNKKKLVLYIKKLNRILNTIKTTNVGISKSGERLLNIRIYYSKFYLFFLKWYSNQTTELDENYPDMIYFLSKKNNNSEYLLKVMHNKAVIELTHGYYEAAKKTLLEGYHTAKGLKKETEYNTFASMLLFLSTKIVINEVKPDYENILKYYYKIKESNPLNMWTVYLENSLIQMYHPEKKKEIFDILREQVNSNILQGDYAFAVYWRFNLDSEAHCNKLYFSFKAINSREGNYLELDKVGEDVLQNIEKTCLNTSCYYKELKQIGFLWEIYKMQLIEYFFNEDNFNYDSIVIHINKMLQMKEKKKISGLMTFRLIRTCVKMLEYSDQLKYMLSKYELKFIKHIDEFKNNPSDISIMDYAVISSLARRLNCIEITNIAKGFYQWIETNHSEILAPVFRELKEMKLNIHTVSSTDHAA